MSESDPKNHWQNLANQVGAEIRPEPEPSGETSASEAAPHVPPVRERRPPAPQPRRTANHWSSLASELGLEVPEEPEPPESLAEAAPGTEPAIAETSVVEDADISDAVADNETEFADGETRIPMVESVGPRHDPDISTDDSIDDDEIVWSRPETDEAADSDEIQFEQLDSEGVDNTPDEDTSDRAEEEEETGARRRKRRGRRRRRRRDDETTLEPTAHSAETAETIELVAIGSADLEEIEIVPIEENEQRDEEDDSDQDNEPRGRRKRRRGRRGSRRRDESPATDENGESGETSDEADDSDEEEADANEPRAKHRKIPTWEQTLAGMIDANIKNHAATENSGRRGRGRRGR